MSESLGSAVLDLSTDIGPLDQGLAAAKRAAEGTFGAMGTAALAVVGAVAAVGAGLYKLGASFDEQYDKIRTNTGATGEVLEGLQEDFREVLKSVPTDFDSAGTAIADLNRLLGLSGDPLREMSKQLLNLSRITETDVAGNVEAATGLFRNWNVATEDQAGTLDLLFRASQTSGISVAELSEQLASNGVVLREVGLDVQGATALLATLGKAGVEVGDIMPALSKSLATAAKDGRDAGQVFAETFGAIRDSPSDVEAAGIAMDVFGAKAGPKVAALIREGKLSYEDMLATLQGGTDTINGAADDTADFSEKWQVFRNRVLVGLEPIAMAVFDALGRGMDLLVPKAEQFVAWFREEALPIIKEVARSVNATLVPALRDYLVPALLRVIELVRSVVEWFVRNDDLVKAVGVTLGLFGALILAVLVPAFLSWAASAAAAAAATLLALAPIALVVAAIIGIAYAIIHNWDTIVNATKAAFGWVVDIVSGAIGWVRNNWPLLLAILTGPFGLAVHTIWRHWEDIKGVAAGAIDWFRGLPGLLSGALGDLAGKMWTIGRNAAKAVFDGLVDILSKPGEFLGKAVSGVTNFIADHKGPPEHDYDIGHNAAMQVMRGLARGFGEFDVIAPALDSVTGHIDATLSDRRGPGDDGPAAPGVLVQVSALTDREAARVGAKVGGQIARRGGR